jgi:hypothetical protein
MLTGSATASAAQRYAGPGGSASPTCPRATPCDLRTAIEMAGANDEVIVLSGDYGSAASPVPGGKIAKTGALTIHGEAGRPRPRIFLAPAANEGGLELTGGSVRHLELQARPPSDSKQAALLIDNGRATDVVARSITSEGRGCIVLHTSVLTDSVCEAVSTHGDIFGVATFSGIGPGLANNSVIRNVTAIAKFGTGPTFNSGAGIVAYAGTSESQHLTVSNSIARGPELSDLEVLDSDPDSGDAGEITIDHSNFGFESYPLGHPKPINELDGNQRLSSVQPKFAGAGNYHQLQGSITIDAGADSPLNGLADFDGDPRILGARTDIGADEFVPPPLATTLAATTVTASRATLHGLVNPRRLPTTYRFEYGRTTSYGQSTAVVNAGAGGANVAAARMVTGLAPSRTFHFRVVASSRGGTVRGADRTFRTRRRGARLLSLKVKPRAFRVGGRGAGAKVRFKLSRAARVHFTVQRAGAGRRVGGRCVKARASDRRAKRCTRYVRVAGGFSRRGRAGRNRFRFSGRVKGHALAPGRYRLTGKVPANRKRARFRVVR